MMSVPGLVLQPRLAWTHCVPQGGLDTLCTSGWPGHTVYLRVALLMAFPVSASGFWDYRCEPHPDTKQS